MNDKESVTNSQTPHSENASSGISIKDIQVAPTKTKFETFAHNEAKETREKDKG